MPKSVRSSKIYAILLAVLVITCLTAISIWTHSPGRKGQTQTQSPSNQETVQGNKNKFPPGDPDEERLAAVKAAMKHAWNGYKKYAWGTDELNAVTKEGGYWLGLGATIIDSLDTLWIMGMTDEFYEARDWVRDSFNPRADKDVSFFEATIRILGGLLSAYTLSGDKILFDKARILGDGLINAIKPGYALPHLQVNLETKEASNPYWVDGTTNIAEAGSVQLEFLYLSELTGNKTYGEKVLRVLDTIWESNKEFNGFIPVDLRISDGKCVGDHLGLGSFGDSFYEYLLKIYLFLKHNKYSESLKYRNMFDVSMQSVINKLVLKTTDTNLTYIAEFKDGKILHKMDHLVCFAGAMFALGGAKAFDEPYKEYFKMGEEITHTCRNFYTRMASGLSPEVVAFPDGKDLAADVKRNLLRPETVESYFILWRLTHDKKYRDWGWEIFQAFESKCKTECGYAGLDDVTKENPEKSGLMQSYFLSETLKYLYLLYSDDSVISLDDYVFNTEAHPFPIKRE